MYSFVYILTLCVRKMKNRFGSVVCVRIICVLKSYTEIVDYEYVNRYQLNFIIVDDFSFHVRLRGCRCVTCDDLYVIRYAVVT